MTIEISKAAIKYCEEQNHERMTQGLNPLTSGEEDMIFNAFIHGAEYIIKTKRIKS